MHNAVLISMPTNLTQSKKVTLCRNQKEASLFQNCMLGSLQADRFDEWDSLKRNVFHLWLTTSCSKQNWKTILISDHCNGWDTSVWKGNFFVRFLSEKQAGLSGMEKVHPLHTGVAVILILSAAQTQSAVFVRFCGSVKNDKQGNSWNLCGWWVDFTAFLWLIVMTVKMGALEGFWCVCVVPCWVGVTPTCINELLWRLMLAFKSPLALRPWCPPLYPPSFSHTNTVFTQTCSITHAGGYSLIYISGRKHAASLACCALLLMKRGRMCTFVCLFMSVWAKGKVEAWLVCARVCANRVTPMLTVRVVS